MAEGDAVECGELPSGQRRGEWQPAQNGQRERDDHVARLDLAAVGLEADGCLTVVDGAHGGAQPHAISETLGHGVSEALVAGGDPVCGVGLERAACSSTSALSRSLSRPDEISIRAMTASATASGRPSAATTCATDFPPPCCTAPRAIARPAACNVAVSVATPRGSRT